MKNVVRCVDCVAKTHQKMELVTKIAKRFIAVDRVDLCVLILRHSSGKKERYQGFKDFSLFARKCCRSLVLIELSVLKGTNVKICQCSHF
jgi:hypothetical protein